MSNVIPFPSPLPTDEPVQILLDANVKALKLFKALHDAGFVFTFNKGCEVLRISERVQQ